MHTLDSSQQSISKRWNLYFLLIIILTWCIVYTEGIIWSYIPSEINKCPGQAAILHWDFRTEPGEEVRMLQWFINSTILIAYSSSKLGFRVSTEYKGRVEQSGYAGIVIHELSTQDTGNYTLYAKIAWNTTPNVRSVWLNVVEPRTDNFCSCEHFKAPLQSFIQDLSSGKTVNIQVGDCSVLINSSVCCVLVPTIQYCDNNTQMFCVTIDIKFFMSTSTTRTRIVTQKTGPGLMSSQITKTKVPSSLASGLRSWLQSNWRAVVVIIIIKLAMDYDMLSHLTLM
ncbi:hypothetical protein CHS0354_038630 [Potamilus streckersoni]|uniref:Immunoglobulin V-set domain-containing protein n=1 Tax=Potamilus streckersoni TaxID=2493646 RepID=A0AAE0TFW8_9BIVA|nr:hypothetical protein CHS0354_038630 [Potamilus streckersoni]